ncbi:septum site-determining protein MinC [Pseudomonas pohangensis]|jgi:septum site-determining protein MinC|uniref:Probable septum site-determining protein MinC n=1 Tax=Pseudomonas pohangensis TaxID=364197 RepID=A0A1H2F203_9PSED|nr:septum site-determining protein MinC [Pseudomonas pohangensis]SDU01293.1 septum site-determining protein MinC [Pseudomonas pohangensis]
MSQADLLDQDPVFQLKGSMLAITILELMHNDLQRLNLQLAEKVAKAPGFFQNTPLILALDKLPEGEGSIDIAELMSVCRRHGLRTLAVRAVLESHIAATNTLDIPLLPPSGAREKTIEPAANPAKTVEKPAEPVLRPSKLVTSPIRGGQQVYAQGADLIVMAPVSAGAELLADGNIHLYGAMRGRALAGVRGNTDARIFCQQLGAEMLSIAGNYKTAEELRRDPNWGQAVQVYLTEDVLNITRL